MPQLQTNELTDIDFIDRSAFVPEENTGVYSYSSKSNENVGLTPAKNAYEGRETVDAKIANPTISPTWSFSKRFVDLFGSLTLLVLFSPLLVVLYIMVARTGNNAVFGHRRMGKNGNWFTCYKFRTMVPNAELVLKELLENNSTMRAEWLRDEKLKNDPRVTSVGNFLRRTSLDELPQLFNVIKGEMSLVGPRPITETGIAYYGKAIRLYCAVRPGMTGLWQVSGRNEVHFRRRVAIDIYYVRTQSFLLDLKILFRTILVVVGARGY